MPKRMLDDSLLNSPSMAVLTPRAQDAFPRFILLADDFGCFEVNARQLWAKGWPDRSDVSEQDIASWLHEYSTKTAPGEPPPAILWTERGRRWCYLTGWHGEHGQKHRQEYDREKNPKGSKRRTPPPPPDLIKAIVSGQRRSDGFPPGSDVFPPGNEPGIHREGETGNLNNFTPARELTGKSDFPGDFPGSVVPVPVPAAVVVGESAGTDFERLRREVSNRLAVIGPGGGGIPLPGSRNLSALIQSANKAIGACGFKACVDACVAKGEEMRAKGSAAETFGAFRWTLENLKAASQPGLREVVGLGPNGEAIYAEAKA